MDHFALKTDTLYKSLLSKQIHRNFMGYTAQKTSLMIGLGMSAISDSWNAFAQNVKSVKEYQTLVNSGEIPVFRGHILSEEDVSIRQHILNLMCRFETQWNSEEDLVINPSLLAEMEADQLIQQFPNRLQVLDAGKPFVRNVCMAIDSYLQQKETAERRFSLTV